MEQTDLQDLDDWSHRTMARRRQVLTAAGVTGCVVCLAFAGQRLVAEGPGARTWTVLLAAVAFGVTPLLTRRGRSLRTPAAFLLATIVAMIAVDGWLYGGVAAPAFTTIAIAPLMGMLLLGRKGGLLVFAAASTATVGVIAAQLSGIQLHPRPHADGEAVMYGAAVLGALGFVTALTWVYERVRLESQAELASSRARYAIAFRATNEGLFEVHGDTVFLSRNLRAWLGAGDDHDAWSRGALLALVDEQDRDCLRGALDGEARVELPVRMQHRSGVWRWMLCTLEAPSEDGVRVGALRDVDDERRIEQLKSQFVANVSHELRTPLTSLAGALRLMEGGVVGQLPEEARSLLSVAHRNAERLVVMVDDLLDLRQIEAGAMTLELRPTDCDALLKELATSIRPFAADRGIEIEVDARCGRTVESDPHRLAQILNNLLSNAVKYSSEGDTVLLRGRVAERARFEVIDHGPGIPESFLDRLFTPFAQAASGDADKTPGTGLGLSIALALAERLGGSCGHQPTPGGGATFWLELPVGEESRV